MTAAEFIKELQKLPPNAEVGVLAASAYVRPPIVVRVQDSPAWDRTDYGFKDLGNAWLIRPANEVI